MWALQKRRKQRKKKGQEEKGCEAVVGRRTKKQLKREVRAKVNRLSLLGGERDAERPSALYVFFSVSEHL